MLSVRPDGGSNPSPLDCKSEVLPTEQCGPWSITLFKDINELNNVYNFNNNKFISHLKQSKLSNDF